MCSTSKVNDALQGLSSSTTTGSNVNVPSIAAHKIKQHRSQYFLVDIREDDEITEKPFEDEDTKWTLGVICHDASGLLEYLAAAGDNKTMVLVCNTGRRAVLAAQYILAQAPATKVAVLQRGLVGWHNPSALSPDFLVVLGVGDATEKLSLSLAALASAVDVHETVALVLMSDGVEWFVNADSPKTKAPNVETVSHGEPFKPCKAMLKKFLSSGGIILACTTCVKHRQYSFETDMMDIIHPMQMPDLVRMLGEAKGGTLQFL